MYQSAFLTSLQDLVFGLFGSLALLVVVFSIFSEGEHSYQDPFLLVRVEWSIDALLNKSDTEIQEMLGAVELNLPSGAALQWELSSSVRTVRRMLDDGVSPRSVHYLGSGTANERVLANALYLRLPISAEFASVRTRAGQYTHKGAGALTIKSD
jgi:hypothetical protein